MKRLRLLLLLGVFASTALLGQTLMAQNAVLNPLFQTGDGQHWAYSDPSYAVVQMTVYTMDSWCMRKYPGTPTNNGMITQRVHLIAGLTYEFRANIASRYCSS